MPVQDKEIKLNRNASDTSIDNFFEQHHLNIFKNTGMWFECHFQNQGKTDITIK